MLQRAVNDQLRAGRKHELQLVRVDNVDLGVPVAILLRHRREERGDGHAMEVDARAEMPVKIIAIDADADAVLLDDRLCSLQPVLAGQILAVELNRKRTITRRALCDGFERFGPLPVDRYAGLGSER